MTVKELIKQLSECNPDDLVILSSDGEGNDYSPLSDISLGRYQKNTKWSGEFLQDGDSWSGWEDDENISRAVALYPIN